MTDHAYLLLERREICRRLEICPVAHEAIPTENVKSPSGSVRGLRRPFFG
jgi:hypothetical protein